MQTILSFICVVLSFITTSKASIECYWGCYLTNYPDLQKAFGCDLDAAQQHFIQQGQKEGRDCGCECDWQCYLDRYDDDLKKMFGNNLAAARNHYVTIGRDENRDCSCDHDCNWYCYLDRYDDLKKTFGCDLAAAENHYNANGKSEGRNCQCDVSIVTREPTAAPSTLQPTAAPSTLQPATAPTTYSSLFDIGDVVLLRFKGCDEYCFIDQEPQVRLGFGCTSWKINELMSGNMMKLVNNDRWRETRYLSSDGYELKTRTDYGTWFWFDFDERRGKYYISLRSGGICPHVDSCHNAKVLMGYCGEYNVEVEFLYGGREMVFPSISYFNMMVLFCLVNVIWCAINAIFSCKRKRIQKQDYKSVPQNIIM